VLFITGSCKNDAATVPQDEPVIERTNVHYMIPPVVSAREAVLEAKKMLNGDPPDIKGATDSLDKADGYLANLEWFYLPTTEARENLYNAYIEHLSGDLNRRNTYLELANRGLLKVGEKANPQTEPFIRDLTERLENIQIHIHEGAPVDDELRSLCETIQLHLLKARLVVDENAFHEHS
jgi:hypothetical protein